MGLTVANPPGYDARFPTMSQTKHCWQSYVDYHKCITAKGDEFKPCRQVRLQAAVCSADVQFYHAYRAMCPTSWTERWDELRGQSPPPAPNDATDPPRKWNVSGEAGRLGPRIETVRPRCAAIDSTMSFSDAHPVLV